jgi:hypothetical protein
VAFLIGGIEIVQVYATEIGATTGVLGWLNSLNFEDIGYFIIASFLIAWAIALAWYRYKGYEKIGFSTSAALPDDAAANKTSNLVDTNASATEKPDNQSFKG